MSQRKSAIDEVLRSQHGVISRAQARGVGCSDGYIAGCVRRREWERVAKGVFRARAVERTWLTDLVVACLSLDAVASHRSAARLWNIDGYESANPEVTIPRAGGRIRSGVIVHESTQTDGLESVRIRNVPCTAPDRTVLDLGAVVTVRQLEWAMDDVLRRELVTVADLEDTLARHCGKGRNGCGPLRELLAERGGCGRAPDSRWNRMVFRLLVNAGLPRPEFEYQVDVGGHEYRLDLAYPDERVAIELDSVRWHLNRSSFDADAVRRNALTLAGWEVLTFTYRTFRDSPERLCASVRAALRT